MFAKILIANRGEIACRIIRTTRRLGIKTVAVYSEADAGALHVEMADEAIAIGPATARDSYLNIARLIAAAQESGAEAIHPGYGFLSESADFAAACEAAEITFIGPPAAAMRAMGSKATAKTLMERAGVTLVPGYHGADQSDRVFLEAARTIGYPVLIKASAGGGGKGMRIVATEHDLVPALASARREAASAFGDDQLLLEKYLEAPRHIEVQIFADQYDNVIHLFERDCSIQRRHQKLIEEAPAPGLGNQERQTLWGDAIAAARAVDYVGAGTIEFVAARGRFYFIEMNTRLQVEHVATEMITGLDLVEWQLRIAAGERLPLTQDAVQRHGHAVEVRLYAEDPARDFLPVAGTLGLFDLPRESETMRVETGLRASDKVTPYYDALLAKLIAWGKDRAEALRRIEQALATTTIAGLPSNRDVLRRIVQHRDFRAAPQDTGFIARHNIDLVPSTSVPTPALLAASFVLICPSRDARLPEDRTSPWQRRDFWRLFGEAGQSFRFRDGAAERTATILPAKIGYRYVVDGESGDWRARWNGPDEVLIEVNRQSMTARVWRSEADFWVISSAATVHLVYRDPRQAIRRSDAAAGKILAPMPGKITAVLVEPGAPVTTGQVLLQIEAMKMELAIVAPSDGVIAAINVAAGALVDENVELIVLGPISGNGTSSRRS